MRKATMNWKKARRGIREFFKGKHYIIIFNLKEEISKRIFKKTMIFFKSLKLKGKRKHKAINYTLLSSFNNSLEDFPPILKLFILL